MPSMLNLYYKCSSWLYMKLLFMYCNLCVFIGANSEAIKWLKYAIKHDTQNAKFMFMLAEMYRQKNDYRRMKKYYNKACVLGYPKAMFYLARYYHNDKHDLKHAIKYYIMAAEHSYYDTEFNEGDLYYRIGFLSYLKNDYPTALKYFNMALESEPNDYNSMFWLGAYYEDNKDYEKMIMYYKKSAKLGCGDSMLRLAEYYEKTKLFNKKILYYGMYYSRNPLYWQDD